MFFSSFVSFMATTSLKNIFMVLFYVMLCYLRAALQYAKHGGLSKVDIYTLTGAGFHVDRRAKHPGSAQSEISFISIPIEGVGEGVGTNSGSCWAPGAKLRRG